MAKNDFRVTSIFKIIIRVCMKNVEFCRKTSNFLPKRCLFIFCIFYFNEIKELNQQVCLIKYVENKISNSTSHKKKEERKHRPTFLKLLKNFHQLHQLLIIANYRVYHLWSNFDENFKNKNRCQILNLVIVTSKSYIFIASMKDLNVLQISTELLPLVLPFIYKSGNALVKYLIVAQAPPY